MKAEGLVDALADMLGKVEAMTPSESLAKVNAKVLMDTLADTLPDVKVMTLIYSLA